MYMNHWRTHSSDTRPCLCRFPRWNLPCTQVGARNQRESSHRTARCPPEGFAKDMGDLKKYQMFMNIYLYFLYSPDYEWMIGKSSKVSKRAKPGLNDCNIGILPKKLSANTFEPAPTSALPTFSAKQMPSLMRHAWAKHQEIFGFLDISLDLFQEPKMKRIQKYRFPFLIPQPSWISHWSNDNSSANPGNGRCYPLQIAIRSHLLDHRCAPPAGGTKNSRTKWTRNCYTNRRWKYLLHDQGKHRTLEMTSAVPALPWNNQRPSEEHAVAQNSHRDEGIQSTGAKRKQHRPYGTEIPPEVPDLRAHDAIEPTSYAWSHQRGRRTWESCLIRISPRSFSIKPGDMDKPNGVWFYPKEGHQNSKKKCFPKYQTSPISLVLFKSIHQSRLIRKLPTYGRLSWLVFSPSWQTHHHLNHHGNHIVIK